MATVSQRYTNRRMFEQFTDTSLVLIFPKQVGVYSLIVFI